MSDWSVESWKSRPALHQPAYDDARAVETAVARLRSFPPLVTSWEIERLKGELAEAQQGRRFILQGGDCAESLADCTPDVITNKLKILLQMSLVLVQGARKPITRIGRFAGQYAKPRSSATETRTGPDGRSLTLPSYFGDLINSIEFTPEARTPNPHLMVRCYQHAALTLNFIRSLIDAGFADLHHPEYWELAFCDNAALHEEYHSMVRRLSDSVRFMETIAGQAIDDLTRVEFFTSHEGLHLLYESAGTRTVPRRQGHYNLTAHLPWIGDRCRAIDGAHVEFFRGIRNPIGVKLGTSATPDDVLALIDRLNPANEPGRLVLIHRMGLASVQRCLPPLLEAVSRTDRRVLWVCDPMHGNTKAVSRDVGGAASRDVLVAGAGTSDAIRRDDAAARKTRDFADILGELDASFDLHAKAGTFLGGVHFELTGDHVTECTGGARGLREADLDANYRTMCDPRLNYEQSLEMSFLIARRLASV